VIEVSYSLVCSTRGVCDPRRLKPELGDERLKLELIQLQLELIQLQLELIQLELELIQLELIQFQPQLRLLQFRLWCSGRPWLSPLRETFSVSKLSAWYVL
jgi:hypothetical protein